MTIVNKKTIIAFVLGVVVMGFVWGISASLFTNTLPGTRNSSVEIQQRMMAARQTALARSGTIVRSGSMIRPMTGMERILPWTAAVNFIETASIEKIELSSGLEIKLIMKNGPTFTATQPTKDAYLVPLKKAKSKIEVVK